ncbi:FtsX-like permease family protein [Candidatus Sumerlaeota bacterium]|nr:FtsX-like permease family protein [Candidatus Sumerlaeota bacterium]
MAKYEYQSGKTIHGIQRRRRQLPIHHTLHIAWQNIRVRLGRSLLVTSGIILALAFLTYIRGSDILARNVVTQGPPVLGERIEELEAQRQAFLAADPQIASKLKAKNADEDHPPKTAEENQFEALQKKMRRTQQIRAGLESEGLTGLDDKDARIQTRWMLSLAMLVSFVGILNAMLLSVTERYAEIGTMKCLGALDSLIVELFLIESFFQGVLGTTAGIVIGLALTLIEGQARYGSVVWTLIPYGGFLSTILICFTAGIVLTIGGALYPGYRAAKMRPVEAMRAEV